MVEEIQYLKQIPFEEKTKIRMVQLELLEQYAYICSKWNIPFFTGPELSEYLMKKDDPFPANPTCKIYMTSKGYAKFCSVVGKELDFKKYFWCYETVFHRQPFIRGILCKNATKVQYRIRGIAKTDRIGLEVVCLYPWKKSIIRDTIKKLNIDIYIFLYSKIKNKVHTSNAFVYKLASYFYEKSQKNILKCIPKNEDKASHYIDLSEVYNYKKQFLYPKQWFLEATPIFYKNFSIQVPSGNNKIAESLRSTIKNTIETALPIKLHEEKEKQAVGKLRRLQLIEIDLLKEIDRICRKHNIHYSIIGGTMIGALRHQGFIPWDDDIDVSLERNEYEKLMKILPYEYDTEKYFLQTIDTDIYYNNTWARFQRKGTIFAEPSQLLLDVKKGIHIDILPYDHIHKNKFIAGWIQFFIARLKTIMWANKGKIVSGTSVNRMFYRILSIIPKSWAYNRILALCLYSERNKGDSGYFINVPKFEFTHGFCALDFAHPINILFEGMECMLMGNWQLYIQYFEDYMSYPPKKDRIAHCPGLVDVGDLYKEIGE